LLPLGLWLCTNNCPPKFLFYSMIVCSSWYNLINASMYHGTESSRRNLLTSTSLRLTQTGLGEMGTQSFPLPMALTRLPWAAKRFGFLFHLVLFVLISMKIIKFCLLFVVLWYIEVFKNNSLPEFDLWGRYIDFLFRWIISL